MDHTFTWVVIIPHMIPDFRTVGIGTATLLSMAYGPTMKRWKI